MQRSCNTLDERDEVQFENIKPEMKNIFKGKREKRKKVEIQTEMEVKQRSGETDIDNIIDKNEAKIAKYNRAEEKDEESELEKINVEKLAIRSEKESKTIGANTKGVNSELDKKSDKLEPIGKLKEQKFEMASNQIIDNKNIKRKVAENEKVEIKEVNKVQHTKGEVKFVAITAKSEIELRESCDTEHEEYRSERKQKEQGREPIDKGKILGENEKPLKQKDQNKKVEQKKRKEERRNKKKNDYQMMKSENNQNVNKEGSLNEKGKKEKEKYEISQKQNMIIK